MYPYINYFPPFPFFLGSTVPPYFRFAYPAVETKIFIQSVKSFSPLMKQGSELLRHLANPSFAHRIMDAAQQGNQEQVDRLLRSIGIKAPITTRFSPTGIMISLHSREDQDPFKNCCSLTFSIKWGL